MTDLPCCRLCKQAPILYLHPNNVRYAYCDNEECELYQFELDDANWCRLMNVPEKMQQYDGNIVWSEMFVDGYNAAIDAMSKGE